MEKQQSFRQLLPAASRTGQLAAPKNTHSSKTGSKRKRPYTKNACKACRGRKSACDGVKPDCTTCQTRGEECVYELLSVHELTSVNGALTQENESLRTLIIEFVHHLQFLPLEHALYFLHRLRTTTITTIADFDSVLQSIQAEFLSVVPSAQTAARSALSPLQSGLSMELMLQHPTAYPLLDLSIYRSYFDHLQNSPPPKRRKRPLDVCPSLDTLSSPGTEAPSFSSVQESIGDPSSTSSTPETSLDYDSHFARLNIRFWTTVEVSNDFAAGAISFYLENDHPSFGLFDTQLFLESLVDCQIGLCSDFLVNALLAYASQGYHSMDPTGYQKSLEFEKEAKNLWRVEKNSNSLPTITALILMWFSTLAHGNGADGLQFIQAASQMARSMKLFGVAETLEAKDLTSLSKADALATVHAAWGVFNMLMMQTVYMFPAATEYPPTLPIPGIVEGIEDSNHGSATPSFPSASIRLPVFSSFCRFWAIVSEFLALNRTPKGLKSVSLAFALSKYQKLLALAAKLPKSIIRTENCSSHALVFHIWFHVVVLDLFRQFIADERQHDLKPQSNSPTSPEAIFAASLAQLKHLIQVYSKREASNHSMFWTVGLMYVANATSKYGNSLECRRYFMHCIQSYRKLAPLFLTVRSIVQGLLVMAIAANVVSVSDAQHINKELQQEGPDIEVPRGKGGYILDLDLAITDFKAATLDSLVDKFNELAIFDYCTVGVI